MFQIAMAWVHLQLIVIFLLPVLCNQSLIATITLGHPLRVQNDPEVKVQPEIINSAINRHKRNTPLVQNDKNLLPPELTSMHVESNISNRYAHSVISCRYKNPAEVAQETRFSINLPETAFISGFTMQIKDKVYEAYVKEKEEAKQEYEQAVQSGLGAAHIEQNTRDSNKFTVSVNVEPHSKVTFNLSYEELLKRKRGKYQMVINLHPGQLVKDFTVDVLINETKTLKNVATPALRSGNEILKENINKTNEYAKITKIGDNGNVVKIHFAPTVQQQKEMAKILQAQAAKIAENNPPWYAEYDENSSKNKKNNTENGLAGQFIIEYDVDRNSQGGDIIVNDGYFVHFFAPTDLKPLPKYVIFVLDVSGSMGGRKIEQLKLAMQVILNDLNPEDYFNLVEFSFGAKVWNFDNTSLSPTFGQSRPDYWWTPPEEIIQLEVPQDLPPAYPAKYKYKEKAKEIIENMAAGGGTNIDDALKVALNLTSQGVPEDKKRKVDLQPIIIFLTDGDATDGETNPKVIYKNVDELNSEDPKAAIFSLAFGYDANKDFLKKLSLRNLGFMRQIYEASDAALQLADFYDQISSPLLANVTFKYPEEQVSSVTKHSFPTLFDGSEFVVAGKIEKPKDKILYVHGLTYDGPIDFTPSIFLIPNQDEIDHQIGPLERLWAYISINHLLDQRDEISAVNDNSTEAKDLEKEAIKLALKYSFVTPVTSLVVVKPNETESINAEESKQSDNYGFVPAGAPLGLSGASYSSLRGGGFAGNYFAAGSYPSGFGGGSAGPFASSALPSGLSSIDGGGISAYNYVQSAPRTEAIYEDDTAYFENPTDLTENTTLPWLSSYLIDPATATFNGTNYYIGNNYTYTIETPCYVEHMNLTSTCKLLSQCPQVYHKLDSFDTYFSKYFCTLKPSYAGVCCVDEE